MTAVNGKVCRSFYLLGQKLSQKCINGREIVSSYAKRLD